MHVVYVNVHFRSSLCPESAVQSSGNCVVAFATSAFARFFVDTANIHDKLPLRHAFEADDDVND